MHFYVDETGQTGRNLFDKIQPVLSYGVLSSDVNLDKFPLKFPPLRSEKRQSRIDSILVPGMNTSEG